MTSLPKESQFITDLKKIYLKNSKNPAQLKIAIANYCLSCQDQARDQQDHAFLSYCHLLSDLLGASWLKTNHPLESSNFFTQSGWVKSLAARFPLNHQGEPIPSLPYSAIHYLEDLIKAEMRVFEWGSGSSTLWFAKRVKSIESIEHNNRWYDDMMADLGNLDPSSRSRTRVTFAPQQSDYVRAIDQGQHAPYDIIFIDGISRPDCLRRAIHFLRPGGVIILDDSFRQEYREAFQHVIQQGFFYHNYYDLVPTKIFIGCTSFLSQDPTSLLQSKLPMERRSTVWGSGIPGH